MPELLEFQFVSLILTELHSRSNNYLLPCISKWPINEAILWRYIKDTVRSSTHTQQTSFWVNHSGQDNLESDYSVEDGGHFTLQLSIEILMTSNEVAANGTAGTVAADKYIWGSKTNSRLVNILTDSIFSLETRCMETTCLWMLIFLGPIFSIFLRRFIVLRNHWW